MAKDEKKQDDLAPTGQGSNLPSTGEYARQYIPEEELPMPRLRIVQKETEEHPAGVFLNTQTEETFTEVECIILGLRRGQVRWDATLKNMDEPLCRSRNGVNGEGDPGGACIKCPKSKWTGENSEKPPECAVVYDLIGLDGNGAPFLFSVSRTGIKPARNFIASAQRGKKPLYYTGCLLTLRKETKPATYYVPVFKRIGETGVGQWKELEAVLAQIEAQLDRAPVDAPADDAAEY